MKPIKNKTCMLMIMILLSLSGCQKETPKEPKGPKVTFQDPVFQEIFDYYGYYEDKAYGGGMLIPTQEQLDRMTALLLSFPEGKECDLVDLKLFPNLRGIWMRNATEYELKQISEQSQIKALGVECRDISIDMSVLGTMDNVKALLISAPVKGVADWSFIGEMEQLETLYIDNIHLDNLEFLRPLKNLERLDIDHADITDISALETATRLKYLSITRDDVNDYSVVLKGMNQLEQLYVWDLPETTTLDFLKGKDKLDRLIIGNIGTKILPEWLTTENYPRLGVLRLDKEMEEIYKARVEEMTPILKQRKEQNDLKIRFQDPRINFPVAMELMEPVETYDN